jgi:hypothetical protein
LLFPTLEKDFQAKLGGAFIKFFADSCTRSGSQIKRRRNGAHRLMLRAEGQDGREGVEEIPFVVHNAPGIVVSDLRPNSIRGGKVRFAVAAFSTDDPFSPRPAEARSAIPTWV